MRFLDSLYNEYPIPRELSIWSGNMYGGSVGSITALIEQCVEELASDVMVTAYINATGMTTQMPDDTLSISNVKLDFYFQGNRHVKFNYEPGSKQCFCRFYPSVICYRRKLRMSDLDSLQGDQLRFVRCYMLWKMAEKELIITSTLKLATDIGSIDTSALGAFKELQKAQFETMKPEIHLYTTTF